MRGGSAGRDTWRHSGPCLLLDENWASLLRRGASSVKRALDPRSDSTFLDSVSSPLDSPTLLHPQSEPFQVSAWFPVSPLGHWVPGAAHLLGPLLPSPGP